MDDQHIDFTQTTLKPAMLPEEINQQPAALELYKIAVFALAGIGAAGLLGILVISAIGRTVPDGAIVLASVAVGALAGMVGGQAVNK